MPEVKNQTHVTDELNKLSRNDYLVTLFIPEAVRADAQALLAFAAELRIVQHRVSEPTPGEIRLQWWHDALDGQGHGAVRSNPIASCLLDTIEKHQFPIVPLKRMIAAHRFDLYSDPMSDVNQFEGYSGETRACLYQFIAMALGSKDADPALYADAAGHLGVASTYVNAILAFGRDSSNGKIFLPYGVFQSFGVDDKVILAGQNSEAMRQAMAAHLQAAEEHLAQAQAAIKLLPKNVRPAFVDSAIVRAQLRFLSKRTDNPFLIGAGRSDLRKLIAMFVYSVKN